MEIILFMLLPLVFAVFGIAMIANAIESIKNSMDEIKGRK